MVTHTDMVFCIGPNKAGTTSLEKYFDILPGKWTACHNMCDKNGKDTTPNNNTKEDWAKQSSLHNARSPLWKYHRAFMDNGDGADIEWLYNHFPNSRFVMNVRPLAAWALSRYDMIREIRLGGNCTERGGPEDCAGGIQNTPQLYPHPFASHWVGNEPKHIRGWIKAAAEKQEAAISFFEEKPERRARFTQVDVTVDDWASEYKALSKLHWITRPDVAHHIPGEQHLNWWKEHAPWHDGQPLIENMPKPHRMPHEFPHKHSAASIKFVEEAIRESGCEGMLDHRRYGQCAEAIAKKASGGGLEMVMPPVDANGRFEPFPSQTPPRDPHPPGYQSMAAEVDEQLASERAGNQRRGVRRPREE